MEPQGNETDPPGKPWNELRELDENEKWRDRNAIITKHEHRGNLRCIHQLISELFDEIIDSNIKPDEEYKQQETDDVIGNTKLPLVFSEEFENLLVDFTTEQENQPQTVEHKEFLFASEGDFTPASNFDFELNFFEQLTSKMNTEYLPRDSLFRNFDPLSAQLPVVDKPDTQVLTDPQSADLTAGKPIPEGSSVLDEVLIEGDSSDSEVSENKEISFCSCQTKFPEETHPDALTSEDDYESTNEEVITDCKLAASPVSRFTSTSDTNNLEKIPFEQDFGSNSNNLEDNFLLPNKQTEFHEYNIENEEFRPSHEVDLALEYLEDLDIGIHDPNMPRESLFTRFDPLTQHTMQPNELPRRNSQLSNSSIPAYTYETPAKPFKHTNLLTFSTPPKSQQTPRLSLTTPKPTGKETNMYVLLPNMTPVILDKPIRNVSSSDASDSRSILRYTETELRAERQTIKESGRFQLVEFQIKKDEFLASEKSRMLELLANEHKKSNYMIKSKAQKLEETKGESVSAINSLMICQTGIEGKCQSLQADVNLYKVRKEILTEELAEADRTIESSNDRMQELEIDIEKIHSRKCRIAIDCEDMVSSLTNFQTKISEAKDSLKSNLNRNNELITKIEETAKASTESENRFNRYKERVQAKLTNANIIHEEHSRDYKQKMLVLKTELRTMKMELSDIQLSIKNFEAKNENLQGIAKEMMALHQPIDK